MALKLFAPIIPFVVHPISRLVDLAVDTVYSVVGTAASAVTNVLDLALTTVGTVAGAAVDAVTSVVDLALDTVSNVVDLTLGTVHSLVDTIFHPFASPLLPLPPLPPTAHDTPPVVTPTAQDTPPTEESQATDVQHETDSSDAYYFNIGDGELQIADTTGDNDTLVIDDITDQIDATGIEAVHTDGIDTYGVTDLTADELVALGAQLG
jgi:hypothetical protein